MEKIIQRFDKRRRVKMAVEWCEIYNLLRIVERANDSDNRLHFVLDPLFEKSNKLHESLVSTPWVVVWRNFWFYIKHPIYWIKSKLK